MGERFTFSEVADIVSNGAINVAQEVAVAARQVYCNFAQNSPFSVIYNNPLTSPLVTRALEELCGTPPPPPPPPPYTGGQCPVQYTLRVTCQATQRFEPQPVERVINLATVVGAITGLSYYSSSGGQIVNVQVYRNGGVNPTVYPWNLGSGGRVIENTVGYQLIRKDGLPDDCGDIPGGWYPETPPPVVNNINTTVINNAGDENEYSVTINPDINGHISFPPVFNINGVAVGIDIGGISIGEVNIGGRSGGGGGNGSDINPPPSASDDDSPPPIVEPPEPIEEEEIEKDVNGLIGIYVSIVSMPVNAKIVSGNGSPNIVYAGWIEFKRDGGYFPRAFIDFESSYFPAPTDATGYAICLKTGYNGQVQVVKQG